VSAISAGRSRLAGRRWWTYGAAWIGWRSRGTNTSAYWNQPGSCYAFLASAHDARLRVNAFNHASTAFGDVTWAGQSTRHVKQALEEAGLTKSGEELWSAVSPCSYYEKIVRPEVDGGGKRVLLIYGNYDLTFRKNTRWSGEGIHAHWPQL